MGPGPVGRATSRVAGTGLRLAYMEAWQSERDMEAWQSERAVLGVASS